MIAASYWSLLAPAIEMVEASGSYGFEEQWAFYYSLAFMQAMYQYVFSIQVMTAAS